ncbi:acyl-coenzyme A thioesterase PaaI-like protein [Marmoricola sp. OAE513]|uniref:PaaI family thioesterase n=1 Tax=Marmoricola sp. OAE513 TaxID=2817894 RepID=UPI001DAEDD92
MEMTAFKLVDVTDAEVDEVEERYGPLAAAVRELVDATIRSNVGDDVVGPATEQIRAITEKLRADQVDGPAGVNYNATGRAWNWGNAAIGLRNGAAPPMEVVHDPDGRMHADVHLGAAYEGPPGCAHGGVSALLLDHIMGVTASGMNRVTLTGTLTLRYVNPLPLGDVRLDAWISGEEGRKVFVDATIKGSAGVALEAHGVFIIPRWSGDFEAVVASDAGPS